MKNKLISIILGVLVSLSFINCGGDDDADLVGDWVKSTDFDGVQRGAASVFVIGKDAYLVGGYNHKTYFNETWKYDSEKDTWQQMANFPGAGRQLGVAFAINGKGYYGTGKDKLANKRADFYEYDPANDAWTAIDSFPGAGVVSAVGFAVGNFGYVGTGYTSDGSSKIMYKYDPASGSWSQVESVKVSKRYGASTFTIGETVYFIGGVDNSQYVNDFYSFNPTTGVWTELDQLKDYNKDLPRDIFSTFTIGGKGYITCGRNSGVLTDTWAYDPSEDKWTEVTAFEGAARFNAIGFAIGDYGYVATGNNGSSETSFFDDIWKFDPTATYDDEN